MKAKPPLERVIQKQVLDYLLAKGYFVWRQNQVAVPTGRGGFRKFNGMPGLPDLCGLLPAYKASPPMALYIEIKRPGRKLTPEQETFIQRATMLGHMAFMATSLADVKAKGL